jgi:hypothetical protein
MTFMKTVTDPVTVADFEQLETTFPGIFRGGGPVQAEWS